MKWMIGVDGGGTSTTALAADLDGRVLGRTVQGPSNYHTVGTEKLQKVITDVLTALASSCQREWSDLSLVCLGMAGMDRPQDREIILDVIRPLQPQCEWLLFNDARIALAAGTEKPFGVALIAGTGSIAYGLTPEGAVVRAGGWGHAVSDEGSGYDIGRTALARSLRSLEGRDISSRLPAAILAVLGLKDVDELIGYVYHPETTKKQIAALTETVAACAAAGDELATAILRTAADELAGLALSVLERGFAGYTRPPVVLSGSVATRIPAVRAGIESRLSAQAEVVAVETEPAAGAIRLACRHLAKP